jgi:hypothetical protein
VSKAEWLATPRQAQMVISQWLRQYNHVCLQNTRGTRPSIPEALLEKPKNCYSLGDETTSRRPHMRHLKRLIKNPVTDVFVALVLIATSLTQGWGTIISDLVNFHPGVHHGVLFFGLVTLVGTIPDLIDGLDRMSEFKKTN